MSDAQVQVKKGRKFDQVLDAAIELFLTDGFVGTNMDAIAAQAGVSKATVYSYFPDKKLLFLEATQTEIARRAIDAEATIPEDAPVPLVLEFTARILVSFYLSDFGQNLYRVTITEAESFPELAQMFYDSGSKMVKSRLSEYFTEITAKGQLNVDDPILAAAQYIELCKADIFDRSILGLSPKVTNAEIDRVVDGAVRMFMARYGVAS